ncbi:MAG TPA: SDR family oxidoreductase [Candidatus Omnitrophota bacterium]|nr:SDR family oxidoreductase [Candidatus Omnitrophota bacterium]
MAKTTSPKIVLITGCSSGFGLLTAAHLAERGHQVIATMRNLDRSSGLVNEVNKRGALIDLLPLDVTKKETIKETMALIAADYGYLDCLVNNAGYGIGGAFEDLTEEEIREQMETNFFGVQNVTREAIHLMRQRGNARIINISSVAGFSASPCFSAYNASKWALEGFSESLHYELKPFGIKVLLIEPGVYKTKIFFENRRYATHFHDPDSPYYDVSQHLKKRTLDYVEDCHKDPEDVARLVEKLMLAKNPAFRNHPDWEARIQYLCRKYLPFWFYSRAVESFYLSGFSAKK